MAEDGQIPGQPRATNMQMVSWDSQLAQAAQTIADRCVFAHASVPDSKLHKYFNTTSSKKTINENEI